MKKILVASLQQSLSFVSASWVVLNLLFWMLPILVAGFIKILLPPGPLKRACHAVTTFSYRGTVWVNSFWMVRVLGIKINVEGELPDHPAPVIVCNHQSWFDIPVLQHVITDQGPIIKFMIKQQLIWVPVLGWICLALNFPRLRREERKMSMEKDFFSIRTALADVSNESGALLVFPESTRFAHDKWLAQKSPYRHLLIPRVGALRLTISGVPAGTPVLDVTIRYDGGESDFWRCMHKATKVVTVKLETRDASELENTRAWLAESWSRKDRFIGGE